MLDCARCGGGLEETAEYAFYYCQQVNPFWVHVGEWMTRIEPKQLMLLDVGYVVDNVLPPFQSEKGLYDDTNFSHRNLVVYFRHQLRVKIRCDIKCITFDKRWVNAASRVVRKGATLESSFSPFLPMSSTVRVLRDPFPGK